MHIIKNNRNSSVELKNHPWERKRKRKWEGYYDKWWKN